MRHPRARAWPAVVALAAGGLAVAGARTATGRPVISATTLASAGVGAAASGLIVYEWLTPRSWIYGPVFWHARTERARRRAYLRRRTLPPLHHRAHGSPPE